MNNYTEFYALVNTTTQKYVTNMGSSPALTLYNWTEAKTVPQYARNETLADGQAHLKEYQDGLDAAIQDSDERPLCDIEQQALVQLKEVKLVLVKVTMETRVTYC